MQPFHPRPAAEKNQQTPIPKGVPRLCDILSFDKEAMIVTSDEKTTREALNINMVDSYGLSVLRIVTYLIV